jgi:hypothetical protein
MNTVFVVVTVILSLLHIVIHNRMHTVKIVTPYGATLHIASHLRINCMRNINCNKMKLIYIVYICI